MGSLFHTHQPVQGKKIPLAWDFEGCVGGKEQASFERQVQAGSVLPSSKPAVKRAGAGDASVRLGAPSCRGVREKWA